MPATQNIFFVGGGNPNLVPETATTKTFGFSFHPTALPGLDLTVGYYDIRYTNRIGAVLGGVSNILANPLYSSLILAGSATVPPTAAELTLWRNYVGANTIGPNGAIPPASNTIIAIIDNRVQNAGVLKTHGFDVTSRYSWNTAVGRWNAGLNGALVNSWNTAITPGAAFIESVNTNIATGSSPNPLRLRARGQLGWHRGGAGLTASVIYTAPYTNNNNVSATATGQLAAPQDVGSNAVLDLNASYDFGDSNQGWLNGFRAQLNIQNLFNRAPPELLFYTGSYYTKFDPQNASALGRQVSLQLSKNW
jgi:iron complex outermembrane receptor protein